MKAKRILFWVMFLPGCVWIVIFGTLAGIFSCMGDGFGWIGDLTHHFEAWCFDYAKNHKHLGSGIWTDKDKNDK